MLCVESDEFRYSLRIRDCFPRSIVRLPQRSGGSQIHNIPETMYLYYNYIVSESCRSKKMPRQAPRFWPFYGKSAGQGSVVFVCL